MPDPDPAAAVKEWAEVAMGALTGPPDELSPEVAQYAWDRLLLALDSSVGCCRDGARDDLCKTLGQLAPEAVMLLLTTAIQQLAFHTDWRVTVYYGDNAEATA